MPPAPPAAPAAPNASSILETLADLARRTTTAPSSTPNIPASSAPYSVPPAGLPQPVSSALPQTQPPVSYLPTSQPVNVPSLPFALPQMPGQSTFPGMMQNNSSNPVMPFAPAPGAPSAGAAGPGLDQLQQVQLIKYLVGTGIPVDKIQAIVQGLPTAGAASAPMSQPPVPAPQNLYASGQPWAPPPVKPEDARDRGFQDNVRSPPRYHGRSRSRSPDRGWGARGSPRGRDRLEYGRNSPGRGRRDDRRGSDYRQRSPPGRYGRSPSPSREDRQPEKWVDYDPTLPSGHIKVLSRTLFVGGVT